MGIFRKIDGSAALTHGMADHLGADLTAAFLRDPEFAPFAFRSAVMRCAGCREHAACAKLQAGCAKLDKAPGYCRNINYFRDLLTA